MAEEILAHARRLDDFTHARRVPYPSANLDTLDALPPDMEDSRRALVDASQELRQLANRPFGNIREILFSVSSFFHDSWATQQMVMCCPRSVF